MKVDVEPVGPQKVLHVERHLSVKILDHKPELVHRSEVGLSPVEPHEVLTLEVSPDSFCGKVIKVIRLKHGFDKDVV